MKKTIEIKIWRYLTLSRFIDCFLNEHISFLRADTFSDRKEGISNELIALINIYKSEKEKYSDNNSNFPYVGVGNPIDGLVLHSLSIKEKSNLQKLIAEQKKYFISSWFVSEYESMAMWDLYSKPDGVAICTTVKTVESVIKNSNPFYDNKHFKHKKVIYKNISQITSDYFSSKSDICDLFFRKDLSFKHENEYRFVLFDKDGANQIPFKLIKLDKAVLGKLKIIAHPLMPAWQFDNLKNLFVDKILNKNISKSQLT